MICMNDQVGIVDAAYYSLGIWKVPPENHAEFIDAWLELGATLARLPNPPGHGTLIRSVTDPNIFYSFGPWQSLEDIEKMRTNPEAQSAFNRAIDLCTEASPGTYRVVADIRQSERGDPVILIPPENEPQ